MDKKSTSTRNSLNDVPVVKENVAITLFVFHIKLFQHTYMIQHACSILCIFVVDVGAKMMFQLCINFLGDHLSTVLSLLKFAMQ